MRRPLSVVCLAFVLAVSLFLVFYPLSVPSLVEEDGQEFLISGQVYHKESRIYFGSKIPVIYLKNVSLIKQNKEVLPLEGVICYMKDGREPKMGANIMVKGKLKTFMEARNPGEFDMAKYYYIQNLSAGIQNAELLKESKKHLAVEEGLYQIKKYFSTKIDTYVDQEYAPLIKAILLGDKTSLETETKDLYKRSGIIHILSVSGLHVSMIGMGIYGLLRKIGCRIYLAAGVSAILILLYGQMIGMGTSAFRAIFMFGLGLLAKLWGRTYDLLTALSLSAVLLLFEQPYYLCHSGFLLSFGSVLSINIWYSVLETKPPDIPRIFQKEVSAFLVSLSIFLGTLPIHMWFYYETPIYSIFLNLLIIPFMTVIMICGFVIILSPRFLFIFGKIAAGLDKIILQMFEYLSNCSLQLPLATWITGKPKLWQVILYYLGLLFLIIYKRKCKYQLRVVIIAGLVILLSLRFHTGLTITFLDVGQGDGIFMQCQNGKAFLVDGGSSTWGKIGEKSLLPYLKYRGVSRIEAVFVSHGDEDHCSGIKELLAQSRNGIKIERLVLADVKNRESEFEDLLILAKEQQVEVVYLAKGEYFQEGKLLVTCLHPSEGYSTEEANAYSQVLLVEYKNFSALLTGDVEGEGERMLIEELKQAGIEKVTVLKASHHGSKGATGEEFLKQLTPQLTIISCGKNNAYGHPHEELLERLRQQEIVWMRTDECGAITVKTDGKKVQILDYK